jgi:hypothetical protein
VTRSPALMFRGGQDPAWIDSKIFWLRAPNGGMTLEGPDLESYLRERISRALGIFCTGAQPESAGPTSFRPARLSRPPWSTYPWGIQNSGLDPTGDLNSYIVAFRPAS